MKKNFLIICLFVFVLVSKTTYSNWFIFTQRYTADPCVIVYNGRVYVYLSHDMDNQKDYSMDGYTCISSDDLVNWTDHGEVLMASSIPYIAPKRFWAPEAVYRNGKFYLYFCVPQYQTGDIGGTGVTVADNPLGPFTDPRGSYLVSGHIVDPAVMIDDDGQAYLYFPNGRVNKLTSDMANLMPGEWNVWNNDAHEAPYVTHINGKYQYSYMTFNDQELWSCAQHNSGCNDGDANYFHRYNFLATPTGPVVEPGASRNDRNLMWPVFGNNTQPAIFEFMGNYYSFYHGNKLSVLKNQNLGYQRNVGLDRLYVNPDGSFKMQTITEEGLRQVKYLNPFQQVEAETIARESGIETETCTDVGGGRDVCSIHPSDWIRMIGVDFGGGATGFSARIASPNGAGSFEIRLDSLTGKLIGTVNAVNTGGWQNWQTVTVSINQASGIHDLYFKFTAGGLNVNWWKFTGSNVSGTLPPQVVKSVTLRSKVNNNYISKLTAVTDPLKATTASRLNAEIFLLYDNEDGTYSLWSTSLKKYVTAEQQGIQPLYANRDAIGGSWEKFGMYHSPDDSYCFLSMSNNKFVTAPNNGNDALIANVDSAWRNPNKNISRFWVEYTNNYTISSCTAQTLSFSPITDKKYSDNPFTINATASSGLPVSFSVKSGPATLNNNTVTLNGSKGTVIIYATQTGNSEFCPVTVQQIFNVSGPTPDNGTGLNGTYYPNTNLTFPSCSVKTDTAINFNWGTSPINAGSCTNLSDNYTIRWTGYVLPQFTEDYTFFLGSDDGSRLFINDQLIINNWNIQAYTEKNGVINLTANTFYKITIEYWEATGDASVKLFWQSTRVPKAIIPKSQLFPELVGINQFDLSSKEDTFIYPNPASDVLTIQTGSNHISEIRITDELGQVVFSKDKEIKNNETLSIHGFHQGTYIIFINSGDKIINKKILVLKNN